jgi:hypothetical protein
MSIWVHTTSPLSSSWLRRCRPRWVSGGWTPVRGDKGPGYSRQCPSRSRPDVGKEGLFHHRRDDVEKLATFQDGCNLSRSLWQWMPVACVTKRPEWFSWMMYWIVLSLWASKCTAIHIFWHATSHIWPCKSPQLQRFIHVILQRTVTLLSPIIHRMALSHGFFTLVFCKIVLYFQSRLSVKVTLRCF